VDPPQAGGGESDRSDDEDEEEESRQARQARLYGLCEEEVEELIWGEEGLLAARDEADRCAAMLEGGASDRLPGEADCHVKVLPERLEAEAEFMSELREQGLTGDELREEAMGTRAEYEEILAEQHEKASERFAELHEDVQSTGYSLLDLEGLIKRNPSNPAGADAAGVDAAGAGSASAAATSCRRCHRTGVEMSPVSDVGLWKDVAGGINGTGGAGGAGGGVSCATCARRRPSWTRCGKSGRRTAPRSRVRLRRTRRPLGRVSRRRGASWWRRGSCARR